MTQEEKQLLLIDLCARLPYVAFVFIRKPFGCVMSETEEEELTATTLQEFIENDDMHVFPYLRPMSSMTEEECKEFSKISGLLKSKEDNYFSNHLPEWGNSIITERVMVRTIDWLNSHYFDYRGLIPMGLALEAQKDMYKIESL